MKKCNSCNETNLGRFCRDKNAPDGLSYYCKKCNKERHRKWYEKNRQWVNEQSKLWRENNPERYKLIAKRSSDKNREKRIKRASRYRKAHQELVREQQQRYVKNHKEKVLESKRRWAMAHPEQVRAFRLANEQLRRARQKKATIGDVVALKRFYIYVHTCEMINCTYCGKPVPKGKRHVEHQIPISRGGMHSLSNLVPSCAPCNLKKSDQTAEEFAAQNYEEQRI